MNDKTKAHIADWSNKLGIPFAELETKFNQYVEEYKTQIPGKDDITYESYAERKLYLEVKVEKNSNATPFDMIILGSSGKVDVTASDKAEKEALYANVETRGQAIAEKKVLGVDTVFPGKMPDGTTGDITYPAGTPLDTNSWMIPPNPEAPDERGKKGIPNPNFGKPIKPLPTRNVVSFGRPVEGGKFKLIAITERNEKADLVPQKGTSARARINIRDENDFFIRANAGKATKYDPIQIVEYPVVDDNVITGILSNAPAEIAPPLNKLMEYYDAHANVKGLQIVFAGDAIRIGEPTANGSILVVIEDSSGFDLESEGTAVWVPKEAQPLNFAEGSKVCGVARPSKGPGYNREKRELDPSIERIQLNAMCIYADPLFRVDPDEASPVAAEEAN